MSGDDYNAQASRAYQPMRWLSFRAWSLLENSGTIAPALLGENGLRYGQPRLRYRDEAVGFGQDDPFTLTLFHPFPPKRPPVVRKAVWRRMLDWRRLVGPDGNRSPEPTPRAEVGLEPTLSVVDALVPPEELNALLRSGKGLHIPLLDLSYEESVTSDGGYFGFESFTLDQPQSCVCLQWGAFPPPELQPAIDFAERVRAFLESCLPTNPPETTA
jgi:hypothetical protein